MMPPSYIRQCEAALKLYLAPWQQVEHGDKGLQSRTYAVREKVLEDHLPESADL
jgi:hypothetical protein